MKTDSDYNEEHEPFIGNDSNNELVSESHGRRNWKGIALAILVICATIAIIVVTVLYTNKAHLSPESQGTITLEEILSGYFNPVTSNFTFFSDNEIAYSDEVGNFVLYNLDTQNISVLVSNETKEAYSVSAYSISPNKQYVLLTLPKTKVFRHTFNAKYKVYNVETRKVVDIHSSVANKSLQYAAWGKTGDQLVFVVDNNIHLMKSMTDEPANVTDDGIPDIIFNGIPDWVYEEEVLSSNNAVWWSPDGSRLCFAKFNDSEVDEMHYMWYGSYEDTKNVYPEVKTIHYPKPGRTNPTATLYVVDVASPEKKIELKPPADIVGEHYFTTLTWLDSERLLVVWVPRLQVNASISVCSLKDGWKCTENTLVSSDGWVNFYDPIVFTDDAYFVILPKDKDHEHLVMISLQNSTETYLTSGSFEVTKICAVVNGRVYYIRTGENKPNERHFASVDFTNIGNETCYTCGVNANCSYNDVMIGPKGKYFTFDCDGPGIPFTDIRSVSDNRKVVDWTTNEELKKRLDGQVLPKIKTLKVPVAGGYEAIVQLLLPDDFSEKKKYPILVEVYGGPATQINSDQFSIGWGAYLSTVKKYIYARIDGRGSGFRGDKILFELFKNLGTVEIEDQVAVVRYLVEKTSYVDASRTGIWGWSYGGFASSMALATGNNTFKCGASVAPVTSWYYYDSVYTERYMLRPQDNEASYNASMVLTKAKNFQGKKFLLIHGTADDNVHVQQSMMLIESLSKEGILFNTHFYPDQDHSIANYRSNLYYTLQQFFDDCFK